MKKISIGNKEVIHLVGIGGIGMSGLAHIMKMMGFSVQGSDMNFNKNIENCNWVTYLSATGAAANGVSVFTADGQVDVGGVATDITITTLANSSAGDEKETIASIKANAPISFATQQRLVTAEDYKAAILSRYSSTVQDVIAWGGNDNIPPIYGRVYASLKFKDGVTDDVKTSIKNSIQTELSNNLGIMSIDTVFSDPKETFIKLITTFNFDPDLTGSSVDTIETLINNTIISYFNDNLNAFGKIFRSSNLLSVIDALSPAILNTNFGVEIQQRLATTDLNLGTLSDYDVVFPTRLSVPDDINTIISSTKDSCARLSIDAEFIETPPEKRNLLQLVIL